MIKTIFLLLTVLLSFTIFSSANAQTPDLPYIVLDKPEYFYGDVIQATGYFEVVPPEYPDGYVAIEGTISEDTVLGNTRTPIDLQSNTMTFLFDTVNLIPFEHASFPHDGIYTLQMRYLFDDPTFGLQNKYVTVEFEYNTYDYNPTERMDALEGNVAGLQQDVLQFNEHVTQMNNDFAVIQQDVTEIDTNLTTINGTLSIAQQDIIDLQNAPALPADFLQRMDVLEAEVAKIATLETNQNIISDSITALNERISNIELEISSLDSDLTTLQSQQVPTNAELQTSISSNDNDIMMMGLDVSSLYNDLDNPEGLWSKVVDLQTTSTDTIRDVAGNTRDITNLQTEVTTIVNENATPQDVDQNLRMDGIESNITNLFTSNQTQSRQIDETNSRQLDLFQMGDVTITRVGNLEQENHNNKEALFQLQPIVTDLQTDTTENESKIIEIESDVAHNLELNFANRQLNTETNARHEADIELLEDDLASLHLRDQQTEAKMFQNFLNSVEESKRIHERFNVINETITSIESPNMDSINQQITTLDSTLSTLQETSSSTHTRIFGDMGIMNSISALHNDRITVNEVHKRTAEDRFTIIERSILAILDQIGNAGSEQITQLIAEVSHNTDEIRQLWIDMSFKQNVLDAP